MPAIAPIQTSFASGVISPRMRGRVETKPYKNGLAKCENWIPTPQGSLLRRSGLRFTGEPDVSAGQPLRVLPFKSTNLERYQVVLYDQLLKVFTPDGVFAAFTTELVVNGECNLGGGGWVLGGAAYTGTPGAYKITMQPNQTVYQKLTAVPAGTYTFRPGATLFSLPVSGTVKVGTALGSGDLVAAAWVPKTAVLTVVLGAPSDVYIQYAAGPNALGFIDDVSFRAAGGASVATPWAPEDIANLQFVGETGRDRMVFVDGAHEPYVLSRLADGTWTFLDIATVGWTLPTGTVPHGWADGNYPSVVEIWQGRLWFGATPAKKNTFWASKPGTYDFTIGDTAGDAFSYDVAMRGEIRWMQGQKVMLVGCDEGEYSISANDGVVYAGNIDIKQESAFGSAKVQAVPIGDEVIYVSPDRRKVRAIKFSLEGGGWYSRDLTFAAEHITKPGIAGLAFARDPFNTIVLLLQDGTLACCNYDRVEDVNGWWTAGTEHATLTSVAIQNTPAGDEVWATGVLAVAAGFVFTQWQVFRLPLYETGVAAELDLMFGPLDVEDPEPWYFGGTAAYDSVAGTVAFSMAQEFLFVGQRLRITSLATFEITAITSPTLVSVAQLTGPAANFSASADWRFLDWYVRRAAGLWDWTLFFTVNSQVVLVNTATQEVFPANVVEDYRIGAPSVRIVAPVAGLANYVLGYLFTATAETLPLEGGNPAGTAQGMKVHYPDITARLNDSTPPLINGRRAGEGRPFATPLDTVEERVTGDLSVKTVGLTTGGVITIEQDLPFRTEVCAIYGQAQINKV